MDNNNNEQEKEKHKEVKIIVNAREKSWDKEKISYEEVIVLAFGTFDPNTVYTVDYLNGPEANPKGSMVAGGKSVKVKEDMIFNVTPTNKS